MSALKKIIYGVFIFLSICLVCFLYSQYLDTQIDRLYAQKYGTIYSISGVTEKDKGSAWIRKSAMQKDLLLVGSSELSSPVPQNPKWYFPNNYYKHNVSCIGHAYVQNYMDAMDFGANTESFRGSDVVVVESMQWFMGDDIDDTGFMANFSELQFCRFLQNPNISRANKQYLCRRFLDVETTRMKKTEAAALTEREKKLQGSRPAEMAKPYILALKEKGLYRSDSTKYDYPQTHILARLYLSDNIFARIAYCAAKPYYCVRCRFMQLKDKYDLVQYLKTLKNCRSVKNRTINWSSEYAAAEKEGRTACTNNDLYMYDKYYTDYILPKWDVRRGSQRQTSLMTSKEWDDYNFMLSVCRDLGIRPYIVVMSANGRYYDYCGMTKAKRDAYYDRNEALANSYGLKALNLKKSEYEPYFYCDGMHLGWKGWLYVEQNIIKNYSK